MSIRIQGLVKKFGDLTAVHGVDLDVQQGHMLVLLGPSGCGKTTVMRCIVGLEQPTAGKIEIAGKTVFDSDRRINTPVNQRNIGMVFQSYAIWPHMTVYENVAFPLEMKGLPADEVRAQVEEMLAVVGLSAMSSRGASFLSGGQMQRVALARSMVMRPSVLLFDEPLSNLDARLRDHLRIELRELQTRFSITSVFVTHDQQEALALADQVAVMQAGNVLQRDDPISIYRRPSSSTVAEFIGYQNVFPVEVEPTREGTTPFRIEGIDRAFTASTAPAAGTGGTFACIRPGDLSARLSGDATAPLAANEVRGEVTLASFMGSHVHLRVRLDEGDKIFEVFDKSIDPAMRVGARVTIAIPAGAVLLLPRSAA